MESLKLTPEEFFDGLLAAICLETDVIEGEPSEEHRAFYRVLKELQKGDILDVDLFEVDYDPLYGQSGWFDRALTTAQRDAVLGWRSTPAPSRWMRPCRWCGTWNRWPPIRNCAKCTMPYSRRSARSIPVFRCMRACGRQSDHTRQPRKRARWPARGAAFSPRPSTHSGGTARTSIPRVRPAWKPSISSWPRSPPSSRRTFWTRPTPSSWRSRMKPGWPDCRHRPWPRPAPAPRKRV